jgi:excisionase family DNA binding protein
MKIETKVRLQNESELFTASTLAKELGISRSMVYYLVDKGEIKAERISKSSYVILRQSVMDYLLNRGYAVF